MQTRQKKCNKDRGVREKLKGVKQGEELTARIIPVVTGGKEQQTDANNRPYQRLMR